jgi:hypothetical protein
MTQAGLTDIHNAFRCQMLARSSLHASSRRRPGPTTSRALRCTLSWVPAFAAVTGDSECQVNVRRIAHV